MTEHERPRTHRDDGTSPGDWMELINIADHWFESNHAQAPITWAARRVVEVGDA